MSAVNMEQALEFIHQWLLTRDPNYVCVTPAHGIMDCQNDPELRRIFNSSGMTTPDGMSIVWLLRLNGYSQADRVYGPDLMLAVCKLSQKNGWRHFFYGGTPGTVEELSNQLKLKFPDLQIVGSVTPPFRSLTQDEDQKVIEMINSSQADIVWVGVSTPKQERWMAEHIGKIEAPVLIGVGAAFDFLSGRKRQAPRWIQRVGMEWFFRLMSEPRRLWRRYAKYPLFFVLVMSQFIGLKKYNVD